MCNGHNVWQFAELEVQEIAGAVNKTIISPDTSEH